MTGVWFVVVICMCCLDAVVAQDPVVTTQYGQMRGSRKMYNLQAYEEFIGVPFAAPPVDELRWQKPAPVIPWEGVYNATEYSEHCTQFIAALYVFVGINPQSGEDCLYLNIYIPEGVEAHAGAPLPVMVWMYGGAFFFGTGQMYPGQDIALHGNVIIVNFNYRVSTLGWLSTEDSAADGNYGFWDAHAALTWVKENIAVFSGNPDQVTIFGQSAGGSLVSHSVISPMTNNLFRSAIAVSGAATGFFGITDQALRTAVMLSDVFNCTNVLTSQHLVDCLMLIGPHSLDFWGVVAAVAIEGRLPNFAPRVDGDIVPVYPKESFSQGVGNHIHLITGNTYHDAANFVLLNPFGMTLLENNSVASTNESLINFMHTVLGLTSNPDELIGAIVGQYPNMNTEDNLTRTIETTVAMTDWWFGSGSTWEAETRYRFIDAMPTYRYVFKYEPSFMTAYPYWVEGTHIDDVYMIFGEPFLNTPFDAVDTEISRNIQSYFCNFAHTQNPNEGANTVPVLWEAFTLAQNFLQESPEFTMEVMDTQTTDRYLWWMNEFSALAKIPADPTFPLPEKRGQIQQEIEVGVEKLKLLLRAEMPINEEMWAELDHVIDGYVENWKEGIWDY